MQESTIVNQVSPNDLIQMILDGVKAEIENLKASFQPKEPTVYMTRYEVRDLLQVDISTVHNWTKRGKLLSYGIGNRIYFKRLEVEKAIKPIQNL